MMAIRTDIPKRCHLFLKWQYALYFTQAPAANPRAEIHFFGDKTFVGGNDYEIFEHPRTVGHAIADADPLTTLKKLSELFGIECPAALSPPGSH